MVDNRIIVGEVKKTDWKLEQRSIRAVAIQFCGDFIYR